MINLDLRQAVINNVRNNTKEEMKDVIEDSIIGHDEKTLPGLGVLFELIWKEITAEEQSRLVDALHTQLRQTKPAAT